MGNAKRRAVVTVDIDGHPVDLHLTLGALLRFEEVTGRSTYSQDTWDNLNASVAAALIWAALPDAMREEYATPTDLAEVVDIRQATAALASIGEVLSPGK